MEVRHSPLYYVLLVIVSAIKTGHICTGTTLSMVNLFKMPNIHFKSEIIYTECKVSYFTTFLSA